MEVSKNKTTSILQIKTTALNKNNNIIVNVNDNSNNSNNNNNNNNNNDKNNNNNNNNNKSNNNRICDVAKRGLSDKKILKVMFVKVSLKECFLN